jgi:hypothetical protein
MTQVKVIGRIPLPIYSSIKKSCMCDECNTVLDDSFGDPRVKVLRFDSKYSTEPISINWLCVYCIQDQFEEHEPFSIFE